MIITSLSFGLGVVIYTRIGRLEEKVNSIYDEIQKHKALTNEKFIEQGPLKPKKEDPFEPKEGPLKPKKEDPFEPKEGPLKPKKEDPFEPKQGTFKQKKEETFKRKEDPFKSKKEDPFERKEDTFKQKKEETFKRKEETFKRKEESFKPKKESPLVVNKQPAEKTPEAKPKETYDDIFDAVIKGNCNAECIFSTGLPESQKQKLITLLP